jgi:hypothetical protein
MKNKTAKIDRHKLLAAIRRLPDESSSYFLNRAIELLPTSKLAQLVEGYFAIEEISADGRSRGHSLLAEVREFQRSSLDSEYYESFDVNSKNCSQQSKGTSFWIGECNRFLDRCVDQTKKGKPAEALEAFEIIFDLLRHIDDCEDDVIFFADEGGSWQVGVDW